IAQGQSQTVDGKPLTFRGKPVTTWIADLKDRDVAVRRATATALAGRFDKYAPSRQVAEAFLPTLVDTLRDADAGIRRQAAFGWVRFHGDKRPGEQEGKVLLSVLLDALEDGDAKVRKEVAEGLVQVNPDQEKVLAPLAGLLKDSDEGVRGGAARVLGAIEPPGAAVPALTAALSDKIANVR